MLVVRPRRKRSSGQLDAFDQVLDGYEAPPPVHRGGHDTEYAAADVITPNVGKWRARILSLARERGDHGITGWEACVFFHMESHQSTVRARLTELCEEQHGGVLVTTKMRRANAGGQAEIVRRARARGERADYELESPENE